MMILGIMTVLMRFAFIVYALRAHKLKTHRDFELLSRETGILFNNLLFMVLCATVFLGTIYPLILTSLGGETISVGAPFYEVTFIPVAVIVVYLCATATLGRWRQNRFRELIVRLSAPVGVPKVVAICAYFFFDYSEFEALILFAGLYLLFAVVWEFRHRSTWENVPMIIAHGGVAVLVLGLLLATAFPKKVETMAEPGSKMHIADFDITLKNVVEGFHNNYAYRRGVFEVAKHEHPIKDLTPEMRVYPVERSSTTEAAIYHHDFVSNLYIIIGERNNSGLYAVRIYYKPFLNLIWLGCLVMFAGGMLRVILQLSRTRALISMSKNVDHRRRDHDDK